MTSFENPDPFAISRRRFLHRGAITVAGATALTAIPAQEAHACMECVTEKLDGRYPIGKTALVGDQESDLTGRKESVHRVSSNRVSVLKQRDRLCMG